MAPVLEQKPLLKIRAERLRRGWRLVDLAYKANVGISELSRIESGRTQPYKNHAIRIAAVLGLKPEELQEVEQ